MNADLLLNVNSQNSKASLPDFCLQKNIASPQEASVAIVAVLKNDSRFRYQLVYYALRNIRRYFGADHLNGLLATDVVQSVLEKIISGVRRWNKSELPDIRNFLFVTVLSFIRNERIRAKIPKVINFTAISSGTHPVNFLHNHSGISEHKFKDKIFASRTEFLLIRLKEKFEQKNDVYAYYVLGEILNGAQTNIEIADSLAIDIKEVENAKKRIKRKLKARLNKSG